MTVSLVSSLRSAVGARQSAVRSDRGSVARNGIRLFGSASESYILPLDLSVLNIGDTADYSFGMIVKLETKNATEDNHGLLTAFFDYGNYLGYTFQISYDGKIVLIVGQDWYESGVLIPMDTLLNIIVTITGTTVTFYLNGTSIWTVEITRRASGALGGSCSVMICAEYPWGRSIRGNVHDFFVKKALLSSEQIADIQAGIYPILDLHYSFDEGVGFVAKDSSENNNHGVFRCGEWLNSNII